MPSVVRANSFGEAWAEQLIQLIELGKPAGPRGFQTKEILGSYIYVEDARHNILINSVRDLNYKFMVAEWLWISLGRDDVDMIAKYNKRMRDFSDDGKVLYGAYGPRIRGQLAHVTSSLNRDRESRQAVMTTWIANPLISKDIPCTVAMQFIIREEKLHTIVTMRSSDIWLGLPYDFFTFSMIGNAIAGMLGCPTGGLTLLLGSSHLYETDLIKAMEAVKVQSTALSSPPLPEWPIRLLEPYLINEGFWTSEDSIWKEYAKVIAAKTKKDALNVLERLYTTFA